MRLPTRHILSESYVRGAVRPLLLEDSASTKPPRILLGVFLFELEQEADAIGIVRHALYQAQLDANYGLQSFPDFECTKRHGMVLCRIYTTSLSMTDEHKQVLRSLTVKVLLEAAKRPGSVVWTYTEKVQQAFVTLCEKTTFEAATLRMCERSVRVVKELVTKNLVRFIKPTSQNGYDACYILALLRYETRPDMRYVCLHGLNNDLGDLDVGKPLLISLDKNSGFLCYMTHGEMTEGILRELEHLYVDKLHHHGEEVYSFRCGNEMSSIVLVEHLRYSRAYNRLLMQRLQPEMRRRKLNLLIE